MFQQQLDEARRERQSSESLSGDVIPSEAVKCKHPPAQTLVAMNGCRIIIISSLAHVYASKLFTMFQSGLAVGWRSARFLTTATRFWVEAAKERLSIGKNFCFSRKSSCDLDAFDITATRIVLQGKVRRARSGRQASSSGVLQLRRSRSGVASRE